MTRELLSCLSQMKETLSNHAHAQDQSVWRSTANALVLVDTVENNATAVVVWTMFNSKISVKMLFSSKKMEIMKKSEEFWEKFSISKDAHVKNRIVLKITASVFNLIFHAVTYVSVCAVKTRLKRGILESTIQERQLLFNKQSWSSNNISITIKRIEWIASTTIKIKTWYKWIIITVLASLQLIKVQK